MDSEQVGRFLEQKAEDSEPIHYQDVVNAFDLPRLSGSWHNHPLCSIFGTLDKEDHAAKRPWRTALVISKELNRPGKGFFEAVAELRGIAIEDEDATWVEEFNRLIRYYAKT